MTFECDGHLAEKVTEAGEAKAYAELHAVVRAVEGRRFPARRSAASRSSSY